MLFRSAGHEFLVVHFGDHQPLITWPAYRHQDWLENMSALPIDERAYRTYFAIDGVNFQPHIGDDLPEVADAAYLGTIVTMAAGLPLDPVHTVRRELMMRYRGSLFSPHDGGRIASELNRRLVDAGLVDVH